MDGLAHASRDDVGRISAAIGRSVTESLAFLGVGISVGAAPFDPEHSVEHVIEQADAAMYRAKQHGKGAAAFAGEDVIIAHPPHSLRIVDAA